MTLAASTSYGPGGLWRPLFFVAYDPVATAGYNRLSIEYLFSNHVTLRLAQDFYWGKSYEGPWSIGDRFGRSRDSQARDDPQCDFPVLEGDGVRLMQKTRTAATPTDRIHSVCSWHGIQEQQAGTREPWCSSTDHKPLITPSLETASPRRSPLLTLSQAARSKRMVKKSIGTPVLY